MNILNLKITVKIFMMRNLVDYMTSISNLYLP